MTTLIMEKQCGCFKRSDLESEQQFESKDEALQEAIAMCEEMNETFCQKHNFTVVEEGANIVIKMDLN